MLEFIDFLLNGLALTASVGAIYLTSTAKNQGVRILGCLIGIVACCLNIALQINNAPWSTLGLSIICFWIYVKGANIPMLYKKFKERRNEEIA